MNELRRYLETQRNLLRIYRILEAVGMALFLSAVLFLAGRICGFLLMSINGFYQVSVPLMYLVAAISIFVFAKIIHRGIRTAFALSLRDAGEVVEKQSPSILNISARHSEIFVAASFLESASKSEFEIAHASHAARLLPELCLYVRPRRAMFFNIIFGLAAATTLLPLAKSTEVLVPNSITAWSPTDYEVLAPYPSADWMQAKGAITGVKGAKIRFENPSSTFLQTFLYLKTQAGRWAAIPCAKKCEFTLEETGQYAIGTLFSRSSLFPLQVSTDEPPKSGLFAEVAGELVPALALEIISQTQLPLEIIASDDLRLKKIELLHRFANEESVIAEFPTKSKTFKEKFILQMQNWKSGEHEVLLRPYDDFQAGLSTPLKIIFNDEKSIREKRIKDITALINDWVHVLADLAETKMDQKLKEGIPERLADIQYPDLKTPPESAQESMMNVFIKELQALSVRINSWTKSSAILGQVDDLIKRTETEILYGLSLLYQEKAGSIEETSENLASSQADLSKMLEQIKNGKLDLNSKALDEAFKRLAEQLQELQKKIAELPQGPGDNMINREALQQQADESQNLQDRIDEIRKQAQSGDENGALKELESLLNQLSILSKEMERGLDQWKQNVDKGAVQQAQKFMKKVDELKEKQKKLNEKTEALKKKLEAIDKQNKTTFSQQDAKELKDLQDQIQKSEKEQGSVKKEFQSATKQFDEGLEGSEWKEFMRDSDSKALEQSVEERMSDAQQGLGENRLYDADASQKEAISLMDKMKENQKEKMKQMQQMSQEPQGVMGKKIGKIDIINNDAKGEKERRRRIMESLKQQVGEKYQQSHDRYFEELLQR